MCRYKLLFKYNSKCCKQDMIYVVFKPITTTLSIQSASQGDAWGNISPRQGIPNRFFLWFDLTYKSFHSSKQNRDIWERELRKRKRRIEERVEEKRFPFTSKFKPILCLEKIYLYTAYVLEYKLKFVKLSNNSNN